MWRQFLSSTMALKKKAKIGAINNNGKYGVKDMKGMMEFMVFFEDMVHLQ